MPWTVSRRIPLPKDLLTDLLLVVAVTAVTVVGTAVIAGHSPPGRLPGWVGYLLLSATSALLVLRRTAPLVMMVAVLAGSLSYQALDLPGGAFTIPPAIALFSTVSAGHRIAAVVGTAVWSAGTFAVGQLQGRAPDLQGTVWFVTWLAVVLVVGEISRNRREQLRAERERVAQAERAHEEESRRRVSEERLRIARELHDVLAHSISVINLQAGVSEHLMDRDPEQARVAIGIIKQASKEVLVELRSTLGMLRSVDDDEHAFAPVPGTDRLQDLVERARDSGLDVALTLPADLPDLPRGVDLAVYRIVQESLTNVIRHARAGHARVDVGFAEGDVLIEVRDDGTGVPYGARLDEGNGLVGMRERVMAVGGTFQAGPQAKGGFLVHARLPSRSVAA
ncbi:sensor histidine kinase [Streptosporangium sp. NPDC000396]|uniref:sensor histidine kinase n=1 Tax=Streptosporangium sp. NPDC000396 TaxID=3366185 RepID=UPI0036D1281F